MSSATFKKRQESLRQNVASADIDCLALNPGSDLSYLTGLNFHLMERPVVAFFPAEDKPTLVLPELEMAQLDQVNYEIKAIPYTEERSSWPSSFQKAVLDLGLQSGKLGTIPRRMRLLEYGYLREAAPELRLVSAQQLMADLRMTKDSDEISLMREAVRIAECALQATLSALRPGVTEKEIASRLVYQLLHQGSDPQLPFFPIVSFGSHTANPHAAPTDRELQFGDLVLIDWGAAKDGYYSDITRTFAMGDVDPVFEKIAEFVQQANQAAREAVKIGIPAAEVDQIARGVIEKAGYGDYFIHRTGHGIGREAHEEPYISSDDQTLLEKGMTFTIEPGIYLPHKGGVRIEDDILVTDQGGESLSHAPRELTQLFIEE